MVSVSTSRAFGEKVPIALMCAPGEIHSSCSTGSRDVVAVTIMSAPLTAASAEATVSGVDIIVTATPSRDMVLQREWISPGAHINAIGTFSPKAREVDTDTIAAARLFVDRRESALNEAGDYLIAAQEGAIGPEHIRADLGEVL